MSKYLEKAEKIRASEMPVFNCTQSVLLSFCEEAGIDEKTACKLGCHFGGGMKTGSVCGVITGALMTLGLFGLDNPSYAQKVFKFFKENHNNELMCADLLRINAANGGQKKTHCDALVFEMVEYLESVLKENNKI